MIVLIPLTYGCYIKYKPFLGDLAPQPYENCASALNVIIILLEYIVFKIQNYLPLGNLVYLGVYLLHSGNCYVIHHNNSRVHTICT